MFYKVFPTFIQSFYTICEIKYAIERNAFMLCRHTNAHLITLAKIAKAFVNKEFKIVIIPILRFICILL